MTHPTGGSPSGGFDPDAVADAARACDGVADLAAGLYGEIVSYLPGRTVAGVRSDEDSVSVHIVAEWGRPLTDIAADVARAVSPLIGNRRLEVSVDDVELPEDVRADA